MEKSGGTKLPIGTLIDTLSLMEVVQSRYATFAATIGWFVI